MCIRDRFRTDWCLQKFLELKIPEKLAWTATWGRPNCFGSLKCCVNYVLCKMYPVIGGWCLIQGSSSQCQYFYKSFVSACQSANRNWWITGLSVTGIRWKCIISQSFLLSILERSEFLNRVEPCYLQVTCCSRIFVYHNTRLVVFLVVYFRNVASVP